MAMTTQEVQGEILDAVRKGQDALVDAIKQWAETVQTITPSIPVPSLPYTDKLPKPEELVASAYEFDISVLRRPRRQALTGTWLRSSHPMDYQRVRQSRPEACLGRLLPSACSSYRIHAGPQPELAYHHAQRQARNFSRTGTATANFPNDSSASGSVIIAGYGITAPELNYDDYSGIDANGKVVLIFNHEPQESDANSVFNGKGNTRYTNNNYKLFNAQRRGAIAVLTMPDPNHQGPQRTFAPDSPRGSTTGRAGCPAPAHPHRSPRGRWPFHPVVHDRAARIRRSLHRGREKGGRRSEFNRRESRPILV